MKEEKIILGIDPGTSIMGFGLIKKKGSKFEMIMMDVLIMNKISDPYIKLQKIFQKTLAIIDHYHPDEVALEAPFFGKNVQSMLKLGRAQGVAMAAALQREIPVTEYAPLKIKKAIRTDASPRHVPSKIIVISEIPKTKNGKLVELAVKQSIEGDTVKNLEALANPDSLKQFKDIKELNE